MASGQNQQERFKGAMQRQKGGLEFCAFLVFFYSSQTRFSSPARKNNKKLKIPLKSPEVCAMINFSC